MPELPEVETICRQLDPELRGRRIAELHVLDRRWCRPVAPELIERAVTGRRIDRLERRGKYLLLRLDGDEVLVMHLRMSGNLILLEDGDAVDPLHGAGEASVNPDRYLRARFVLDSGAELRFTDPRRFGEAFLLDGSGVEDRFAGRLGIEPLSGEFTPELLGRLASGRTAPLKSFLLDQAVAAGIGNIYADEALFRAALHPLSPAGSMRPEHTAALRDGVVEALRAGLAEGGASIDDYRDARGQRGSMQDEFLVHTREGEPCLRCGAEIRRIVVSGRSTYFCPGCQVRLRRRRTARRRRPKIAAR